MHTSVWITIMMKQINVSDVVSPTRSICSQGPFQSGSLSIDRYWKRKQTSRPSEADMHKGGYRWNCRIHASVGIHETFFGMRKGGSWFLGIKEKNLKYSGSHSNLKCHCSVRLVQPLINNGICRSIFKSSNWPCLFSQHKRKWVTSSWTTWSSSHSGWHGVVTVTVMRGVGRHLRTTAVLHK